MQSMLLSPGKAVFAQSRVSVLIGIITSVQIIIRWICQTTKGSRNNKWISPPISLFEAGVAFSYIALIPFALNFLYKYGQAIGVETFLNNQDFISFVLQFFLGFGIAFDLPIVVFAISILH
jgi:sec-independent protein translocase protein TatC